MRRICKNHSSLKSIENGQLMEIDNEKTQYGCNIQPEYQNVYQRLDEAASICMQKELKIILSNISNWSSELLLKYLIMFRYIHTINPLFSVLAKLNVNFSLPENDPKEKSKFKN